jgi:hypothetical protein
MAERMSSLSLARKLCLETVPVEGRYLTYYVCETGRFVKGSRDANNGFCNSSILNLPANVAEQKMTGFFDGE